MATAVFCLFVTVSIVLPFLECLTNVPTCTGGVIKDLSLSLVPVRDTLNPYNVLSDRSFLKIHSRPDSLC